MAERSRRRVALIALFGTCLVVPATSSVYADCNANGVEDAEDIALAVSADCNANGVPDECEVTRLDLRLAPGSLRVPRFPREACVVDVDGDGDLDLLSGNQNTSRVSTVSVLLNDGGEFRVAESFSAGEGLVGLRVADVDADGDTDAVTANQDSVGVLLNQDGVFGEPLIDSRHPARGLASGDWNGDGLPDLVSIDGENLVVRIAAGRGDGRFELPDETTLPATAVAVELADLHRDGLPDIVVAHDASASILGSTLDGLRDPVLYDAGTTGIERLEMADVDGDAAIDLVLSADDTAAVLRQREDDGFEESLVLTLPAGVDSVGSGDLDDDGDSDLIFGFRRDGALVVLRGSVAEGYRVAVENHGGIPASKSLAVGDFDGDGVLDVALVALTAVRLVWGGQRDGTALSFSVERHLVGAAPHRLTSGDVDGDADLDVVTGNSEGGVSVFLNRGDGSFPPPTTYASDADNVAVVDVDLDGALDIASVDGGDGGGSTLRLHRNVGDATFEEPSEHSVGAGPWQVTSGDLDGDGAPDIVTSNRAADTLTARFNDGRGQLPRREDFRAGSGPVATVVVDLDRDGASDIAAANSGSADVLLLWSSGGGSYTSHFYPLLAPATAMVAADADTDGRPDLVVAAEGARSVNVLWQTDSAARVDRFSPAVSYTLSGGPGSVSVSDIDRDGAPDIVTAQQSANAVAVLFHRGPRVYTPSPPFPIAQQPRSLGTGDLDGDGDTDLFTANRGSGEVAVLLNEGAVFVEASLPRICVAAEFRRLSAAGAEDEGLLAVKFLAAAVEDEDIAPVVFQNTRRFPAHEDFLREELASRFGSLTGDEYDALTGRRATRRFFAGTVKRRELDAGVAYSFSVIADTSVAGDEALRLAEVRRVYDLLQETFHLEPLSYEPDTVSAREESMKWDDPPFPVFFPDDPVDPGDGGPRATPSFVLEIPPGTLLCGVFPQDTPGREPRIEYESKSQLRLRAGDVPLTTDEDVFEVDLVQEIRLGPRRERAEAQGPGQFRVLRLPAGDGVTVYRFQYTQSFRLGAEILEISWFGLDYRARGDTPLEERIVLDGDFVTFQLRMQATLGGNPFVTYSSCDYALLPRWEVEVAVAGGGSLRLTERFAPVPNELDTGRAALVAAEVSLGGVVRVVDDYWRLAYAARRHNREVVYWIVLDEPFPLEATTVQALEVVAPEPRSGVTSAVSLLGADFVPVASLPVTEFTKVAAPEVGTHFRRGDADEDGDVNLRDAVFVLEYLFRRGAVPGCRRAADFNADGRIRLTDPIALLSFVFGLAPPPAPSDCGPDSSEDALDCARFAACP